MENLTKRINIGPCINVGHVQRQKVQSYVEKAHQTWKYPFNKRRAFNKAVGPGKKSKLINVGLTSIQESKVPTKFHL